MGVLPAFRGRSHGLELVHEAPRIFTAVNCWRIFCDTGTDSGPMVKAFRQADQVERDPWQRPLAQCGPCGGGRDKRLFRRGRLAPI